MARISLSLAACGAVAAALVVGPAAAAAPAHYDFALQWTSGQLAGQSGGGGFHFDPVLAQPLARWQGEGLLGGLNFSLRGVDYDAGTANANYLEFDRDGRLAAVTLGTHCNPTTCWVDSREPRAWSLTWHRLGTAPIGEVVAVDGPDAFSRARLVHVASAGVVPEPQALVLWALGLAALGLRVGRRAAG